LDAHDKFQKPVIVKIFKHKHAFKREAQSMLKIGKHTGLIQLKDILKNVEMKLQQSNGMKSTQKVNAIVMEKGKIDLFSIIQMCGAFTERTSRFYFKQILEGLNYCHLRN